MGMSKIQMEAGSYLTQLAAAESCEGKRLEPHDLANIRRLLLVVRDSVTLSDELRGRYMGYVDGVLQENGYYFSVHGEQNLDFHGSLIERYVTGVKL